MKIKKYFLLIIIMLTSSCGEIDFTYQERFSEQNPLYDKTKIDFSGREIKSLYKYASQYFGTNKNESYNLKIDITEKQTRRSVQNNQAVSKVDYELTFNYILYKRSENCEIYNQNIISRFTYVPKSSGHNFGSDRSLDKQYDLAVKNNVIRFIDFISGLNSLNCINEN